MIEINKLSLSVTLGRLTKDEAIEQMRRALVYAMRIGDRLVLHCGKYGIDFVREWTCPVNFPTNLIFNFDEWRKEENYKRVVRPEEDVDLLGNKKCYFMNDNFDLIIVQDIKDLTEEDDKREEFKKLIPHMDSCFEAFFVSRDGADEGKPKPSYTPMPQLDCQSGMHVVSFNKSNVVTHHYH